MRRGRALTGILWPIGIAVTALLGIVAGGNLLQNTAAPASGDAGAKQPAASTSPEDKKNEENPPSADEGSAAGSPDNAQPGKTTASSQLMVSHKKLVFYARHHLLVRRPYNFEKSTAALELVNVSPSKANVILFAQDIEPLASSLTKTPPGQIPLVISEADSGGRVSISAADSSRRLSRQTSITIPSGATRVFTVRPANITHPGVYGGVMTVGVTWPTSEDGEPATTNIPVRVVTTHGPFWPLLVIALGVIATTWVVFSRTVAREKTLFLLRIAGLRQRLRQLCDLDRERPFSSRLEERCRDMLRQATRNWQQQNTAAVDAKLKECETLVTSHADAAVVTENAEAALSFGRQVFVAHDQPRFLAGSLLLKQANTSLDIGDSARAKTFAENALEVYHDAFGLYQRLKIKWQVIDELLDADQLDADHRLGNARIMAEEARQRAETLIDNLSRGKDGVKTTEAEQALQRLDYWKRALETVTDAIHTVPCDCDPAQRRLDQATELLATATLENVRLPRAAGHNDNLLKAEQEARSAVELCESQRLFALLAKWLPENDGSLAAKAYADAEEEAAKSAGDIAKVLTSARKAVALLQLTELERASWQWPDGDNRRDLLKLARKLITAESYQAALKKLPWESSYRELAAMLQLQRMLFEACRAGEPPSDSQMSAAPSKFIDDTLKVLKQVKSQEVLARHYLFELDLRPLGDHPEETEEIEKARANLEQREPVAALGAIKRLLDLGWVQEKVAESLLSDAELVNHRSGDVAWEAINEARGHLENQQWARAMWKARKAWLLSRRKLAGFYTIELSHTYPVTVEKETSPNNEENSADDGNKDTSEVEVPVVAPGGPEAAELAKAKTSQSAGHWSQAVYHAHSARQQVTKNLAGMYQSKLSDRAGDLAMRAEALAKEDKHDEALELLIEQLARETVADAQKVAEAKKEVAETLQRVTAAKQKVAAARQEVAQAQEAVAEAQQNVNEAEQKLAKGRQNVNEAERKLAEAHEELDISLAEFKDSCPTLATALTRLGRHDYFPAYQAALAVPADSTRQVPQLKSRGGPEGAERGDVHLDIAGFRAANIFWKLDFDIVADVGDQPPRDPDLEAKYRQAAAKRKKLAFRTDLIQIPQQWKHIFESYLPDPVASTDEALARADAMAAFVEQNTDRISSMDASDAQQQAAFRTALCEVANGRPQDAQQELESVVLTLNVTLDCRNRGVTPVANKADVMGSDFWVFLNYISRGLFVRPQIDEESSVEDAFLFEAKIDGADGALRDRFAYEWKVERQAGGFVPPASWLKTWEPEEKIASPRIDINQHGVMKVSCTVTDPESVFEFESKPRFFRVRRSPHRVALRLLSLHSLIEVAFVIVIASLLGLLAKYYARDVETFGSLSDYLLAFVWGATSKYGQEGLKSLTGLLTPSIRTDQSPAASAASET
jgi:hypothetical protein